MLEKEKVQRLALAGKQGLDSNAWQHTSLLELFTNTAVHVSVLAGRQLAIACACNTTAALCSQLHTYDQQLS
jgi:hypothetical protein